MTSRSSSSAPNLPVGSGRGPPRSRCRSEEKTLYCGERLILRYGCFGCHDIDGFENAQKIGVDLSTWGSKMVTRLDFGYVDIDHTRQAWLEQKLRATRVATTSGR